MQDPVRDSDLDRREDLLIKVEKAIAEFFVDDYWPIVNAIREEFGLPAASLPDS